MIKQAEPYLDLADLYKPILIGKKKFYQELNDNGTSKSYAIGLRYEVQKVCRVTMDDEKHKPYKY